jgi:hypothetical protein
METLLNQFAKIDKEAISGLRFPENEVLKDPNSIVDRNLALNRALSLGNLEHSKARIYFEDDTSLKMVETTVWGLTDKRVILKQGIVIPINRIHSVKF